jgi:hypothetical protein
MKKRYLALITLALALGFYLQQKSSVPAATEISDSILNTASAPIAEPAEPLKEEAAVTTDDPVIPTFFPKAKVIAEVADPVDAQGRQRVIQTVETSMKEPYVRVERTFVKKATGGRHQVGGEVAMVSNQLLLEKPDSLDKATFETLLRQAGAKDVTEIGDAFLATFAAEPRDPHALDTFVSRVKEVAGADVTVEPNYLRKLF